MMFLHAPSQIPNNLDITCRLLSCNFGILLEIHAVRCSRDHIHDCFCVKEHVPRDTRCVQCPVTLGECKVLSAPGNPALSHISCLSFKVILEQSLDQIWNGTTVSRNKRLSDTVMKRNFFPLICLGLALPVTFTKPLQNQQAEEGGTVTLSCEISKSNAAVKWKKAGTVLRPSEKYKMHQTGSVAELTIRHLSEADGGEYTCDTGDQQTTAAVLVKGGDLHVEQLNWALYHGRGT